MSNSLKVVSYNVNGTFNQSNTDHVVKLYQETEFDVLCIQEVKQYQDQLDNTVSRLCELTGINFGCESNVSGNYSGVAIIFNKDKFKPYMTDIVNRFTDHKL